MRKRKFLFGNEIHIYLLPAQRILLLNQMLRTPKIPGLLTVEKARILKSDPYISQSALGTLCDWFPDLVCDLRQLEIRRQAVVDDNAALAR